MKSLTTISEFPQELKKLLGIENRYTEKQKKLLIKKFKENKTNPVKLTRYNNPIISDSRTCYMKENDE